MVMVIGSAIRRGLVYLVDLDPTRGSEIRKTRPCLVVSPDELNGRLRTVIVAPLTSSGKPYPFRVSCHFAEKDGFVVLDQLRTVDQMRLVKSLGSIDEATLAQVFDVLAEMFSP
jgi:mRNA interferase MazF